MRSGHGFGVKIVGGKIVTDKSNEVGAFVTAIQRGGIADQLHGELQEGTSSRRLVRRLISNRARQLYKNISYFCFR